MTSLKDIITSFDTACELLVASDKSLQERLEEALKEISWLEEKDMNADLRKGFRSMQEKIHAYQKDYFRQEAQTEAAIAIFRTCVFIHIQTWE